MNLTFKGFLKLYCRELSGGQSLSYRKLVVLASTDAPRVAEPMWLLAWLDGKAEYLLGLSCGTWMEAEYARLAGDYGCEADAIALLEEGELPNRYQNVWRAFCAKRDAAMAGRRAIALMRSKTLQALDQRGESCYSLCKHLGLNRGNVYAYLHGGDDSKVSRATARRIYEYAMSL